MWTFHLTLEKASAFHAQVDRIHEGLRDVPEVDPVPREGLHLTMNGVGFTDEVSAEQAHRVADAVLDAAVHLPVAPLVLEEFFVGEEAAGFAVRAEPWLEELSDIQRRAVESVLGDSKWGAFRPHISITYSRGEMDMGELVERIAPRLPADDALQIERPVLTLMELHRDDEVYTWTAHRQMVL